MIGMGYPAAVVWKAIIFINMKKSLSWWFPWLTRYHATVAKIP